MLSEPLRYDTSQYIKIEGIRLYAPRYPIINYGDRVVVQGQYHEGLLKNAELVTVQKSKNILFKLRKELLSVYQRSLPPDDAALVAGVSIGSKTNISPKLYEKLKKSGTLHVVVASGMNVTLVGGFLVNGLVNIMNRKKALIIALFGVWAYVTLSGFDPPLIRAAIMGSIAFSAQEFGKAYYALRALILSGLIMLLINPLYVSDVGFLLSFTATLSLILFENKINRLIHFVPSIIKEDLSTTLAAQIGVTPILLVSFGSINIFSPFINSIVLWTIPFITVLGFIMGITGLIVPFFARLISFVVLPFTQYFLFTIDLLS